MLVGLVSWVCRVERRGAALMADWGGGILVEGSSRMEGILGVFFFFFSLFSFACGVGVSVGAGSWCFACGVLFFYCGWTKSGEGRFMYRGLSYLDKLSQTCTVQGVLFAHISTYGEDPSDSKLLSRVLDYGVIRLLEEQIELRKAIQLRYCSYYKKGHTFS